MKAPIGLGVIGISCIAMARGKQRLKVMSGFGLGDWHENII